MKITKKDKKAIYVMSQIGMQQKDIADQYKVSPAFISGIVKKFDEEMAFYGNVHELIAQGKQFIKDEIDNIKSKIIL